MPRTHYDKDYNRQYNNYNSDAYANEGTLEREGHFGRSGHHSINNTRFNSKSNQAIKAAKGYHGIVRKPTYFLTGEKGPERVNITPQRKHHKTSRFSIWKL